MMKTKKEFTEDFEKLIIEKRFNEIFTFLTKTAHDKELNSNIWNFVSKMCLILKTTDILKNDSDFENCKNILLKLVERGSPKEMLIALLEEADTFNDNFFFCLILHPLKATLLKMPEKRGKSLEWVLSSLNAHIQTLPLPGEIDLQGDEKLLLDIDPAVIDAVYILQNYLNFLEPFVNEIAVKTTTKNELDKLILQKNTLSTYILFPFYHPLLYQDLHISVPNKAKSTIRVLCEKYVNKLCILCPNVLNLLKFDLIKDPNDENMVSETVPSLAFSNLMYLIMVENLALKNRPFVYNHKFMFISNLKYINLLLSRKENLILFKGLYLTKSLLDNLKDFDIVYHFVELSAFAKFSKSLISIGIFCEIWDHRKLAVELFLCYIQKCDWKGRYHTIMQVICSSNHSGTEGLAIKLYKNYINDFLNGKSQATYFLGKNFKVFLTNVFYLKDGVETDILEDSDKILSALNFLRYLLLRDIKSINTTGIWDAVDMVSDKFLKPLSMGLNLSRAHYKKAIVDVKNGNKNYENIDTSVTVNNAEISSSFHKEDVYERAILTFDLIESILCRVNELI